MEASSLASISDIASNPPPNLNVSSTAFNGELVLYLAKVPGSRDVFLSPMKPRERVVTAEDVQSSLYYVHVNSDADFAATFSHSHSLSSANGDAGLLLSPNQPPAWSVQTSIIHPSGELWSGSKQSQQVARKPMLHEITNISPSTSTSLGLPEIPPRPLPRIPGDRASYHQTNPENLRPVQLEAGYRNAGTSNARSHEETRAKEPNSGTDISAGSLTLIRRDPFSSEQWNVASIHDPPVYEVSSAALRTPTSVPRVKSRGAPLYLDITNPGYTPFMQLDRPVSRHSSSADSEDSTLPPGVAFRRRLYMPGSRFAEHGYGHRRFNSEQSVTDGEFRRTLRSRTNSDLSESDVTFVDKRSKSYTFTSPWNGRCEFFTGTTGKSLRCRHIIDGRALEVSELRFNLPASTRNTPASPTEQRSSYFSHLRGHAHESWDGDSTPSVVIDEDGRLDLSLGRERAGGGFGGRRAKLGKLIVHPEGLKMLDLLVAANVSLWWRAYDRTVGA